MNLPTDFKVTLTLTLPEVNKVLECLGAKPYLEVAELLHNIKRQGDIQVALATEIPAATPPA